MENSSVAAIPPKISPLGPISSLPPSPVISPQPTIIAQRFEDAEVSHLITLIADMINRLILHNDQIPLSNDALTRFHSRSPPSITVAEYLQRIVRYANVEKSCLLITLHYIDLICTRLPHFTITSLTVHRFIISSVTVSSKALCDVFCTNSHYAKVGGVRMAELNMLEREFCSAIDWRLICTGELLQSYYVNLVRTHSQGEFKLAEDQPETLTDAEVDISQEQLSVTANEGSPPIAGDEDDTTHPGSSAVSNNGDDDIMQSASTTPESSGGEDEAPIAVSRPPVTPPNPFTPNGSAAMHSTPRSAKRDSSHVVDMTGLDNRPKGRRRLEGTGS